MTNKGKATKKEDFGNLVDFPDIDQIETIVQKKNTDLELSQDAPVVGHATGKKVKQHSKLEHVNYKYVDPARCKPWKYHNRNQVWYTKERCKDLIEEFESGKEQLEAGIVRKISDDPLYDYEVIAGMRRRYAKEFVNQDYKVVVRELDDQQAAIIMNSENRYQDVSKLENAINYMQMLDDNLFESKTQMAKEMGYSKTEFFRMLKCAEVITIPQIATFATDLPKLTLSLIEKLFRFYDSNEKQFNEVSQSLFDRNKGKDDSQQLTNNRYLKQLLNELIAKNEGIIEPFSKKKVEVGGKGSVILSMNKTGLVSVQFDINEPPEFDDEFTAQDFVKELQSIITA